MPNGQTSKQIIPYWQNVSSFPWNSYSFFSSPEFSERESKHYSSNGWEWNVLRITELFPRFWIQPPLKMIMLTWQGCWGQPLKPLRALPYELAVLWRHSSALVILWTGIRELKGMIDKKIWWPEIFKGARDRTYVYKKFSYSDKDFMRQVREFLALLSRNWGFVFCSMPTLCIDSIWPNNLNCQHELLPIFLFCISFSSEMQLHYIKIWNETLAAVVLVCSCDCVCSDIMQSFAFSLLWVRHRSTSLEYSSSPHCFNKRRPGTRSSGTFSEIRKSILASSSSNRTDTSV